MDSTTPFYVKDCTLAAIATGIKAQTLAELRDRLGLVPEGCIYYHFWGGRLRTEFAHHEYHNDFSHWAHNALHDEVLSERLELIDPTDYDDLEALRDELIGLVENRLDEHEVIPWAKHDQQFHFSRSKIIIFSTRYQVSNPEELADIVPKLTQSSIFYHFIDAARRLPERGDDFSAWLEIFGSKYQELISHLRNIDPYFISLANLQLKLSNLFREHFQHNAGG